jgi:hypothetical protein
MKNLIPLLCFLLLLMNCQKEQIDIANDLAVDNEASPTFHENAFPEQIFLPIGFHPEGIVNGNGSEFFVGSLVAGAIYKGDLRTGEGSILVPQQEEDGRYAVGLDYDERTDYLFVAGLSGYAYVYNATTGADIASIELTTLSFDNTLINDCVVTKSAVYFTDTFRPFFYRVSLLNNGRLPNPIDVETIPLSGDLADIIQGSNGIVATPNGKKLIIGNAATGHIYLVNPSTGVAQEIKKIDLGEILLPANDGLVLQGKTLYVVQPDYNQISVVELSSDYKSGEVVSVIAHPEFKIPATATLFGSRLYAVNARFDEAPPPIFSGEIIEILFDVIGVPK